MSTLVVRIELMPDPFVRRYVMDEPLFTTVRDPDRQESSLIRVLGECDTFVSELLTADSIDSIDMRPWTVEIVLVKDNWENVEIALFTALKKAFDFQNVQPYRLQ